MPPKSSPKTKTPAAFLVSKPFKFILVGLFFYFLSHALLVSLTTLFSVNLGEDAKVEIISNPGLHILANQDPTRFDLNQDGIDDYLFGYGCYRLEPSEYPNLLREDYSRKKELGFTCEKDTDYTTSYFQTEELVFVASKDGKTYMYKDGLFSDAKVFTESGWKPGSLPSDLFWSKTLSLSYTDVKNGNYGLPWFYVPINLTSNAIQSVVYFFTSRIYASLALEFILFIATPIFVDLVAILSLVWVYFRIIRKTQPSN